MRLTWARVGGYRRFAATSDMELDGDLICIVGPNGAGKSSFLDALAHLSSKESFSRGEKTRTEDGGSLAPLVWAKFQLDDQDRNALSSVPEAAEARIYNVFKTEEGGLSFSIEPKPKRRLDDRQKVGLRVKEFQNSPWLAEVTGNEETMDPPPEQSIHALADSAVEVARSEAENLGNAEIGSLLALRQRLEQNPAGSHPDGQDMPKKYQRIVDDLQKLLETEELPHPHRRAVMELEKRQPPFVKFERADRDLRPQYDLDGEPDRPIENLLALAGSNWTQVTQVVASEDKGRKTVLLENLNRNLQSRITEAWGQSPLTVRIDIDGTQLTVLMSMEADDYIEIDQQSDGLRQFVALRAFVTLHASGRKPVILIDEADMHLHYDAQADLVSVFEEQDEAAAIIYTTHSAGCLPRDIGVGLRGVAPIFIEREDGEKPVMSDHSEIINGFWFTERGFSPLLIAMGASAFAFSSAQKALVTEGFTDSLLLPSLMREACGISRLDYQVVPGFARAHPQEILDFDLLAARVAYLADGDDGGRRHVDSKLKPNGVAAEQIRYLGGEGSGITLEDLIAPEVWCEVVNELLETSGAELEYPIEAIPKEGRMAALEEWCEAQSLPESPIVAPTKAGLAKALLDRRKRGKLVSETRREMLRKLDEELREIFAVATARLRDASSAG